MTVHELATPVWLKVGRLPCTPAELEALRRVMFATFAAGERDENLLRGFLLIGPRALPRRGARAAGAVLLLASGAPALESGLSLTSTPTSATETERGSTPHEGDRHPRHLSRVQVMAERAAALGPEQTLGEYVAHWLAHPPATLRPSSVASHRKVLLREVVPPLGRVPLAELRPGACDGGR